MPIEPFNPARHGGVLESYSMKSRSGITLFLIGAVLVAIAFFVFFFAIRGSGGASPAIHALFWIPLGLGVLFFGIGVYNMIGAQNFNSTVRRLRQEGFVTRGSIQSVRHTYRWFGRTRGANRGDTIGMDTGWFFVVSYKFEDDLGRIRKSTANIPDLLGPKRQNTPNQSTFIDPNMPRVGHMVDVLFDYSDSVVLRLVPAT
ncbi:MAG: hypothetical protein FWE01_00260 [Firmicutes bacterium]|nr:hypothetical protein [Bacillota bacterium]